MNTLLKFSALWCSNCPTLSKTLKAINLGSINLVEVDIDQQPELTKTHNIRALPTLVLLNDEGKEIKRCTGSKSRENLVEFLGLNN